MSSILTLADMRAAVVELEQLSVPTMDDCYVVHIAPAQARAIREDAVDAMLIHAKNFASWKAYRGENLRRVLVRGAAVPHLAHLGVELDTVDIADALFRMKRRWKSVWRRRSQSRKARRGW